MIENAKTFLRSGGVGKRIKATIYKESKFLQTLLLYIPCCEVMYQCGIEGVLIIF